MRKFTLIPASMFAVTNKLSLLLLFALGISDNLNAQTYVNRSMKSGTIQRRVSIYLPPGYTPSQKYSLIVYMHGTDTGSVGHYRPSMSSLQSHAPAMSGNPSSPMYNSIIACVESDSVYYGQYPAGNNVYYYQFTPPSNYSVPSVARDSVFKWYSIDTNNVYLCGFSNGGYMALYAGLRTYKLWKGLFLWTPAVISETYVRNKFFGLQFAYKNASKIPICMTVGANDPTYRPIDSVLYHQLLDTNAFVNFTIMPGIGHAFPSTSYMFPCMNVKNEFNVKPILDAGITEINQPASNGLFRWSCTTTFTPNVRLMNRGSGKLTTVKINYKIDNGFLNTYSWTGSLDSLHSTNVSLPSITTNSAQNHQLTIFSSFPNGSSDLNHLNDTLRATFSVYATGVGAEYQLPVVENFEGAKYKFVPVSDGIYIWKLASVGKLSSRSVYAPNFSTYPGWTSDVQNFLPINLSSSLSPWLKFDVAAANGPYYYSPYSDTLYVLISTDCGNTYQKLYTKYGSNLATVNGPAAPFYPSAANQWRTDSIDLSAYKSCGTAFVKFRSVSYDVNNIFIDNINIYTGNVITGIYDSAEKEGINIFPNPFSNYTTIQFNKAGKHYITLYDLTGKRISYIECIDMRYELQRNNLEGGIYLIKIFDEQLQCISSSKVIIN